MNTLNAETSMINELFGKLDTWRHLPAYQLERRADIFFALYLKQIIKSRMELEIDLIIPEFPVRKGTLDPSLPTKEKNMSLRVDYLVLCEKANKVLLVELKTDQSSLDKEQCKNLIKAKEIGIKRLVDGVCELLEVTKAKTKPKYVYLLNRCFDIGWLSVQDGQYCSCVKDYDVEVVFIQPEISEFEEGTVISFNDVIEALIPLQDIVAKRFVESLKLWQQ